MGRVHPSCPNILLIMSDEHAPMFSGTYGHSLVQTPQMDRLAAQGVTFDSAYCNSPLCCPSRMSFQTGRYVHNIGTWDNASPLAADAVCWPHALRAVGYDVVLCGKQHFVGPDQLHGFRQRMGRDLHAELWSIGDAPDWTQGIKPAAAPWPGVEAAGAGTTTEIEIDDEVESLSLEYIRSRAHDDAPWALMVSFIAPHFPLVAPERHLEPYPLESVDLPVIPDGHLEGQHPVYQRMRTAFGFRHEWSEEEIRGARQGYYGLISYLDEKIGRLMDAVEATGQAENTVIIYTSDHGEMNGAHGMWRKSNFYEESVRVPLTVSWPDELPQNHRTGAVVSLVDLVATLCDLSGAPAEIPLDGDSLLPLMQGKTDAWKDEAFSEYLAHGVLRPMAMLRQGRYKLNYSLGDAPELYDLELDPQEFHDLASDPAYQDVVAQLHDALLTRWDPELLEQRVLRSQQERRLIGQAERTGGAKPDAGFGT